MAGERDRSASLVATAAAVVLVAQQVASRATRDGLFLASFRPLDLPKVTIVAAVLAVVAVLVAAKLMARFGPYRIVTILFGVSAGAYALEWGFARTAPASVAAVLYIHVAVFGAIVISGFWSVVGERFDPQVAKPVFARIASGTTFGGMLGGLVTERVTAMLDARAMLLVLAAMHAACGLAVWWFGRPEAAIPLDVKSAPESAIRTLARTPYLRDLALLVLLAAAWAGLLDYALKAVTATELHGADLTRFFGVFYTGTATGTFVLQLLGGRRVLQRFGLVVAVVSLPVAVLVGGIASSFAAGLVAVVPLRALELVLSNSWFRSGYELFYLPLPAARKRLTKTVIDVGVNRIGDAAGNGLVLLVVAVAPGSGVSASVWVACALAACAIGVTWKLRAGYGVALADSVKTGIVKPDVAVLALEAAAPVDGLLTTLDDRDFDVRYRAGVALVAQQVTLDEHAMCGLVERELARDPRAEEALPPQMLPDEHAATALHDASVRELGRRHMEHLANLLGLVLERDAVGVALRGVHSREAEVRRASCAYLEAVLPARIRRPVLARVGE